MKHTVFVFLKDGYWYITWENHMTDVVKRTTFIGPAGIGKYSSPKEAIESIVNAEATETDFNGSVWWFEYNS